MSRAEIQIEFGEVPKSAQYEISKLSPEQLETLIPNGPYPDQLWKSYGDPRQVGMTVDYTF